MFRLILGTACLGLILSFNQGFAIQIIHSSKNNRNNSEINELNYREEQQELLREQIRIQQEMLNLQKHQHYFGK